MTSIRAPTVSPLPPPLGLLYHHHAVRTSSTSRIALAPTPPDNSAPRYFRNPWPSYRMTTLSDAWLAYQRGAAIAPHALTTPGPSRPISRAVSRVHSRAPSRTPSRAPSRPVSRNSSRSPSGLNVRQRDEEADPVPSASEDEGDDFEEQVGVSDDDEWLAVRPKYRGYVRPALSRVMSLDDVEDDWREPPVRVVDRPGWTGEMGGDAVGSGRSETVTWLGHAGVLVQIPWSKNEEEGMCGVLFDPIFSYRCSPSQYVGPARYQEAPCSVDELPPIHVCCISHDHYDHLDYNTILDLWAFHQETIHFFVPLCLATWFKSSGIPQSRVTELDWWHETIVSFSPSSESPTPPEDKDDEDVDLANPTYPPDGFDLPGELRIDPAAALTLKVAFTPAQHRSGRGLLDHMTTLWGSWCVGVVSPERGEAAFQPGMREWQEFKVFFGGDTGYRYATAPKDDPTAICPAFKEIADMYSPFSLSLLPLSTGSSLPFLRSLLSLSLDQYTLTSSLHCSPADSLDIHSVIGARRSIGIHWGTFCDEAEARATRVEFGRCRRERGVGTTWASGEADTKGCFVVSDIGETLVFP